MARKFPHVIKVPAIAGEVRVIACVEMAMLVLPRKAISVSKDEAELVINALAEAFDIPLEIRGGCVVSGVERYREEGSARGQHVLSAFVPVLRLVPPGRRGSE